MISLLPCAAQPPPWVLEGFPWACLPSSAEAAVRITAHPLLFTGESHRHPDPPVPRPARIRAAPVRSGCDGEDVPGADRRHGPSTGSPSPAHMALLCHPGSVLPPALSLLRMLTRSSLVPGQHQPFRLFWLRDMGNVLGLGRVSGARISQARPPSQCRAAEEGRSQGDMGSP